MKKELIIILLLIGIISIGSGTYALIQNNETISNTIVTNETNSTLPIQINESNSIDIVNDEIYNSDTVLGNYLVNYATNLEVNESNITLSKLAYKLTVISRELIWDVSYSEEMDDHYLQCMGCGGFIPLGEENNPLPAMSICHEKEHVLTPDYEKFILTREEAYDKWIIIKDNVFTNRTHNTPDIKDAYESMFGSPDDVMPLVLTTNSSVDNTEDTVNIDVNDVDTNNYERTYTVEVENITL